QYAVGTGGPIALLNNASTVFGSTTAASTLRTLMSASQTNVLQNEHAKISKRALDTYTQVNTALGSAPAANFPLFPTPNSLADQLK
ncbi:Tat pathway signal protein, partial [Pseudomonas sp. GW531-E2]